MDTGGLRRARHKALLAIREVAELSPRTMGAIVVNTVRMSASDRRWRRTRHRGPLTTGGRFTGARVVDDGVALVATFERATLHVRALAEDVVRLEWGPAPAPYDIATRDIELDAPTVRAGVGEAGAWLATDRIRVVVDTERVVVEDASGTVRYEERTPLSAGPRRVLRRVLRDGEALCGLGEQARALDLSGESVRMWNRDPGGSWGRGQDPLYCSIPVTVGLHPTGPVWAFHENTFEARVEVGRVAHAAHGVEVTFEGGGVTTYVAVGELDEVLTASTKVLGAPAMPPRWALGYHHCRWGWRSDQVVGAVLDGFVQRGLPISAIHLDIDYMDRFRAFSVDEGRFGGIDELAARADAHGARIVTILDPCVRRDDYEVYRSGVDGGHFVLDAKGDVEHGTVWPGWAAFPDFTSPHARQWWGDHYGTLTSRGVAGIWHDMNEPTSITLWGDRTLARDSRFDLDGRGGDHAEAHSVYGLLMDKVGFEALERERPGARPFVLSRSGWAGMARYAWHWTADVESSPAGLAQQVPTFLGLGLSGVPFTGSDIGGFSGIPTPALFVRWLEVGVVSPLCRTHCVLGSPDREPWRFPAPYDAAIGNLIRLRYRLLPHLYRLAEEAHRLGHPLWRPVDWPVRGAPSGASASSGAFLLGDELLVVPVADPAASEVTVVLPRGSWRRLRLCDAADGSRGDEAVLAGGASVTLDAPLGQPIVLQREGTVVVLDDAWGDAVAPLEPSHAARRWTLHVVCDQSGRAAGRGYDDAGDGTGPTRTDDYDAVELDARLELSWRSEGSFARVGPVGVVIHGSSASSATLDGAPVELARSGDVASLVCEGPFRSLVAT